MSLVLFSVGIGAACAVSPRPTLYILEPLVEESSTMTADGPPVAVEKVSLPEYLNRNQIVGRPQRYRLSEADSERWAEPLDVGITSVLAENLSRLVPSNEIIQHPWESPDTAHLDLRIRFLEFGRDPEGSVTASAVGSLSRDTGRVGAIRHFERRVKPRWADTTSQVRALSEALTALSRQIADVIRGFDVEYGN